ncbi:Methionine aminopeptidase 2 [Tulasnella sp. 424]|nr:Methionine aminopeptidase 2 [Tulasnella sp. 424]
MIADPTKEKVADETTEKVEDVEEEGDDVAKDENGASKPKKKRKRKTKAQAIAEGRVKEEVKPEPATQSEPPRVGLSKIFIDGVYPEGEICEYLNDNSYRTTSAEKKQLEKLANENPDETYQNIRRAAEVHRQVRQYARKTIRPGMSMLEIANLIEDGTRALVEEDTSGKLQSGIGFPTGLSLNSCAAHYTPNSNDTIVLKESDIMKVDIGVQVRGKICDSAFTVHWDQNYNPLIQAVKEATNTGVREAGIDVRVGDIGAAIQEVMESYEVTIPHKDGRVGSTTYPVKAIGNLTGHNITPYKIHGGKSVPIVKSRDQDKMEEGEYFAIETFGSTGRGRVVESGEVSHYALNSGIKNPPLRLETAKTLFKTIQKNFGTLPWCRRYLERTGTSHYLLALNNLVNQGIVQDYPPLYDTPGSMTAQFEHTFLLRPTCKEIVSRGEDY